MFLSFAPLAPTSLVDLMAALVVQVPSYQSFGNKAAISRVVGAISRDISRKGTCYQWCYKPGSP